MQECECLHHEGFCLVESVKEEVSIQYKKKVMFSLGKYLINLLSQSVGNRRGRNKKIWTF